MGNTPRYGKNICPRCGTHRRAKGQTYCPICIHEIYREKHQHRASKRCPICGGAVKSTCNAAKYCPKCLEKYTARERSAIMRKKTPRHIVTPPVSAAFAELRREARDQYAASARHGLRRQANSTKRKRTTRMKPILFNDDMVRAIIMGEKTATRRIIKPQPKARLVFCGEGRWKYPSQELCDKMPKRFSLAEVPQDERGDLWTSPYRYDDVLYVREAWRQLPSGKYEYRADFPGKSAGKWRPSIHMPKDAARLYLHVFCVRCERLQEITEDRAYDEVGWDEREPDRLNLDRFYDQWRKCYGEASIGENPWVWVISFHVTGQP